MADASGENPSGVAAQLGPAGAVLPRLLARVADPQGAEKGLERYLAAAPEAAAALRRQPERLHPLLAIFSDSRFLTEALIQDPALGDWLERARHEDRARHPEELGAELAALSGGARAPARALALTRFKRREYLRIVLRDSLGLAPLAETTWELSNLADAILAQAYAWAWNDCVARFGAPGYSAGGHARVAGLAVLGLGKLGGSELNYSSDIDLLFLYSAAGETGQGASNREFFLSMAQRLTAYVSEPTPEGACYRVDLRLRPGGREGEIALPLERALAYYRQEAREWERQMLIKARVCAGPAALGQEFLAAVVPLVYPPPAGVAAAVAGAREARARVHAQSGRVGQGRDVKRDPGGLRDIEFLTQMLQRAYGGAEPWLQVGNTLQALQRLHDKGRLASAPWQTLASAYTLFRQIEHRLQLRFGEQTHRLPSGAAALRSLARGIARGQAGQRGGEEFPDSETADAEAVVVLQQRLQAAMAAVAALWAQQDGPALPGPGGFRLRPPEMAERTPLQAPQGMSARGRRHWQRLVESAERETDGRPGLEALAGLDGAARERLAAALEASDFLAEALTLRPAEARWFAEPYSWPDERQRRLLPGGQHASTALLGADWRACGAGSETSAAAGMRALRRSYQTAVWRQAAAELAAPRPLAPVLARLSETAQAAVVSALELARAPAGELSAEPRTRLGVLALGRLGLGEFDLFSDADLVFVAAPGEEAAAARLAARTIALLASYTGDGTVFPVDARLRPEGTQGELVHTAAGLAAYFAERASAWEAASYLKARALAGDPGLNAAALAGIRQGIGGRFAGGCGRAELAAMRQRLEREAPAGGGFKAAPGGYYDADFLVASRVLEQPALVLTGSLAQRLQALAGPAAGAASLPPDEAQALAQAMTVLRAADHAVRLVTGKAPRDFAAVNASPALVRLLTGLLARPLSPDGPGVEIAMARALLRRGYLRHLGE